MAESEYQGIDGAGFVKWAEKLEQRHIDLMCILDAGYPGATRQALIRLREQGFIDDEFRVKAR